MAEQRPPEQEPTSLNPPDQTLLPAQPPAWIPPPPAPPAPPASVWSRIAAFVVLIAVVAAAAGAGIGWSIASAVSHRQVAQSTTSPQAPIQQVTPSPGSSSNNSSIAAIVAKVSPAIVDINTTLGNGQAAGTGIIISPTGEILTNNHVVIGSTSITVTVQGRSQRYSAHVVGVNVSQDVAVIQIDANVSGLPTVTFANSSTLKVGDQVVAIGNALGRGGAHAESGHITALDQTITASSGGSSAETLSGMIESDALIYEGDSGGALVNSSGQVVGMITAGQAQGFRSTASDVGYAISSNTAVGIVNRVRAQEQASDLTYGQVGYLGVSVRTATTGALVTSVQPGSPAESAGITVGSVIAKVGDSAVTSSDTLGTAVRSHRPGDHVAVTWANSTGTHTATVTLAGVNP
ncbi:MAG TPA: trypsin-like peptidase domain-containing protein [Candidatus Dormibacteraeota bacterium]|nr:trypsin-like peptidase domain-containing protein [Candidatus Dormibacteraeota bacterium]